MTSHEAFKFEALEILKPGTSTVLPDYSFPLMSDHACMEGVTLLMSGLYMYIP